ncbi:MAG: hypothetical protein HN731_08200 [Rhodospirillaceae bacterium]|jgi:hypothetical protein|nr:hypothetical protein [Rhodospirillaceae bacterium]
MTEDTFPEHFDGTEVNPEGRVPDALPLEFINGKCTYKIDAEHVHILNKSDDEEEGMQWSEPLSAYAGIRRWVIAERTQQRPGFFAKLFGGRKVRAVNEGPRHAVIALAHQQEPWMSVVLYSRELAEGDEGEGAEEIAAKYRELFSFG